MKLMVLTAAVFPSEAEARAKLWVFLKSCEKFGVEPTFYGIGRKFPGYRAMKLDFQLEWLKAYTGDASHVIFTDSWDAFFCAPLTEIIAKHEAMGAPPILVSAAHQAWPREQGDDESYGSKTYRYPHVGGYIAEIPAIIDAFERMLKLPRQTGDDCFNWFDAWQEGWFRPQVDSGCEIFQVGEENTEVVSRLPGRSPQPTPDSTVRLRNTITGSYPCILHLPGGYTDQVTGKDAAMIPWAKRLGVIE